MTDHSIVDLLVKGDDRKFEPVAHLAAAIVQIKKQAGTCEQKDLIAAGVNPDLVNTHWHFADSIAEAEMNISSARNAK